MLLMLFPAAMSVKQEFGHGCLRGNENEQAPGCNRGLRVLEGGGSLCCSTTCSTQFPHETFTRFFTVHSPADDICWAEGFSDGEPCVSCYTFSETGSRSHALRLRST
jgi:hypothetical protein